MGIDTFLTTRTPDGFKFFDFNKKYIKQGLREIAKQITSETKKAVSRKAVSTPGEFPGSETGTLKKAIKYSVSKSGHSAWISTRKTDAMKEFYPAFVVYGHRGPNTDSSSQHGSKRRGSKVAPPRANYVVEVASKFGQLFQQRMEQAFNEGIKT